MKKMFTLIAGIFCSAIILAQPIDNSGYESRATQNIFNLPATSGSISYANSFSIPYPNPAKNYFQLILLSNDVEKITVQFFDMLGRNMNTITLSGKRKGELFSVDVSGLQNGIYFYRIIVGDNEVQNGKITIAKSDDTGFNYKY